MRMKILLILLSLTLIAAQLSAQDNPEISYSSPAGWIQVTSDNTYPVRMVNDLWEAEIDIFRSELAEHEMVRDIDGMELSVRDVIESFVMDFPRALLLSNTGYNEERRLRFEIEFISVDTTANRKIQHRLVGLIYRHPDNHQILFTLWGRSPIEHYDMVEEDIKVLQSTFRYTGEAADSVFPETFAISWALPVLALMLIVVLFLMKRRHARLSKIEFAEQKNFWRCSCGRLNHVDLSVCRRCGNTRPTTTPAP